MDISKAIKAIVLLGLDGKRMLAKYFDEKIKSNQFDKQLYSKSKSKKIKEHIFTIDGYIVVHRYANDLHMYVVGSRSENPLILDQILNCLTEVVSTLRSDQQPMQENIDQLLIALDEICDNGMVLEYDPKLVMDRVCLKPDNLPTSLFGFSWVN